HRGVVPGEDGLAVAGREGVLAAVREDEVLSRLQVDLEPQDRARAEALQGNGQEGVLPAGGLRLLAEDPRGGFPEGDGSFHWRGVLLDISAHAARPVEGKPLGFAPAPALNNPLRA